MSQIENLPAAEAFELAMALMRQKRWVEAATLWQAFREQYRGHATPWLQGAITLMQLSQYQAADELLAYARVNFTQHVATWLFSSQWARLQKHTAQEGEFLAQGRQFLSEQWELLCKSAEVEQLRGNFAQAMHFNRAAQKYANGRVEPLIQAAEFAEKKEDWICAEQYWQQLVTADPEFRRGYVQLSAVYKNMGNLAQARRYRLAAQYGADLLTAVNPAHAVALTAGNRTKVSRNFLDLVLTKSLLNLKSEASRTYLNYAWVVIEPLLHLIIYYLLFGKVLNAGVENYGLFLLCGLVPWMWFSKSVSVSATSILGGQSLMLNSNVPPSFFPLVSIVQATLKQLPALLLLLLLGMATDAKTLSWNLLYLPVLITVQFILTVSLGLLLAAAVCFVRDLANLVGTGLMLLMFLSGVIYQYQSLPGDIGRWVEFNPLTLVVSGYRDVILQGTPPEVGSMVYVMVVAMVVGAINYLIYTYQRRSFVRRGML